MKYLLLTILIILFSGCSMLTRVAPYEKEFLTQDKMSLTPITQRSEHEGHVFLIREASAGGESTFQGGCGCR